MTPAESIVLEAYLQTAGNRLLTPIVCRLLADLRNTVPAEIEDGGKEGPT